MKAWEPVSHETKFASGLLELNVPSGKLRCGNTL